ncbi:MAG: late competence development ComFB family protein [Candidatus Omnitrophica bacterium]|nr:late competence development ComFB family protein [Candidatus Omnitrophota bacterium]
MELHNYMEEVVKECLDEGLSSREDVCKCDRCKLDMLAWALNRLSPRYIVTNEGRVYTKLQEINIQSRVDVIREVTKAIEHIKNNPRH